MTKEITKTIQAQLVRAMCVDVEHECITHKEFVLYENAKTKNDILKILQAEFTTDKLKIVDVEKIVLQKIKCTISPYELVKNSEVEIIEEIGVDE